MPDRDRSRGSVVDVTSVPQREARRLAGRLTAGGGSPLVLATTRTAAIYREAGLRVEAVATPEDRDRALARHDGERAVRVVPLGLRGPVAFAPIEVAAPPVSEHDVALGPWFVGGAGRSGSWALGRLLGEAPGRVTVHTDLRFHAQDRTFGRLLDGSVSVDAYADPEVFLERYFALSAEDGAARGLQLLASRREVVTALAAFRRAAADDLPVAMRQLVRRLVDPYARGRRADGWVETTPGNPAVADALTTVLPDAHVVHIVRDGRDVATSVARARRTDPLAALERWADELRAADAAFRRADPGRVHVVRFEDLVVHERDRTLAGLLDRLGVDERTRIQERFDRQLDPTRSQLGGWRRDLGADVEVALGARYRALLGELADEGVGCLPVPPEQLPPALEDPLWDR